MANQRIKPCERLYLNAEEADVWFVSDGERIPAHKIILTSASPWFKTMFGGSLPEPGDVDMSDNASPAEFKEFLRFFYLYDVKLTEQNIAGVMNLAKQSMVEEFFMDCENFLIRNLTIETMCWGYQLAILYDAKQLQLFCERAISVNPMKIFKSDSFSTVDYETVHRIMKLDTLLCMEKCVFDACILWAQTACRNNQQNPNDLKNLRLQLKDLLYEIRFTSIDDVEFGTLLHKYADLFSKEETQELIFLRTRVRGFRPQFFNANSRLFKKDSDESDWLTCRRFVSYETGVEDAALRIKRLEMITFSSNKPLLLRGFLYGSRFGNITITIVEKRDDDYILPIFEASRRIDYDSGDTNDGGMLKAKFQMPVIIEPNVKYQIQLEIPQPSGYKRSMLKPDVELCRGTTIHFHPSDGENDAYHSAIQTLFFSSLDNWPAKLFRVPFSKRNAVHFLKYMAKRTGKFILKCFNVIVFVTSLIM